MFAIGLGPTLRACPKARLRLLSNRRKLGGRAGVRRFRTSCWCQLAGVDRGAWREPFAQSSTANGAASLLAALVLLSQQMVVVLREAMGFVPDVLQQT